VSTEFDGVIRKLMELDYYHHLTVDEVVDDMLRQGLFGGHPMPAYYRDLLASRVRVIRSEARPSRRVVPWDKVNETRAGLKAAGKPYGDKAVAAALGERPTTVRRVRREGPEISER
jgi:hypothetical protein